jgi:predicted RNA-binding Zn-ribbon protein involved in translation (DUF1610 family)
MDQDLCYCGEKAVRGEGLKRNIMTCHSCGSEWEITHCWNCGEPIDGRFSSVCRICDWYICPRCGAHEPDCTKSVKTFNKIHPTSWQYKPT